MNKIETIKKILPELKEKLNNFESNNKLENTEFWKLCMFATFNNKIQLKFAAADAYNLFKFLENFKKNNEAEEIKNICKKIFYLLLGYDIIDYEFAPDILYHYDLDLKQDDLSFLLEKDKNKRDKIIQNIKIKNDAKTFYDKIKFSIKYAIFLTLIFTFINHKIFNANSLYEYSTSIFISLFTGISVFYDEFVGIILNITWKIKLNLFVALSKANHYIPSFRKVSYKFFKSRFLLEKNSK